MKRRIVILGIIGQWVGLIFSMVGLILIGIFTNQIWTAFISGGSLIWGLSTKVKYYGSIRAIEKERGKKISLDELLTKHNIIPYQEDK